MASNIYPPPSSWAPLQVQASHHWMASGHSLRWHTQCPGAGWHQDQVRRLPDLKRSTDWHLKKFLGPVLGQFYLGHLYLYKQNKVLLYCLPEFYLLVQKGGIYCRHCMAGQRGKGGGSGLENSLGLLNPPLLPNAVPEASHPANQNLTQY